jgi:vacuolar-type H+-ATPase subunit H
MSRESTVETGGAGAAGPLAELRTFERDLAERLEAARTEAARIVDDARLDADRADADLEAALEREADELRARTRAEAQAHIREVTSAARTRAARYDSVSDETVERLADQAFRTLIGGTP